MEILNKNKKILVIVDTNKLGNYSKGNLSCKNYSYLEINKHLHENIVNNFTFKNSNNITIQIAIPEIVLEEIKLQQNNMFKNDLIKLQELFTKFNKLQGMELKVPEINYSNYLNEKSSAYLGVYHIKKINNPKNDVLPKLIKKVFEKEKPFYKKNDNDSGFKDALIWESILEFVQLNSYDKYFFLTNDPDFNDPKLLEEFHKITGKELIIVDEVSTLKGKLEEEIKGVRTINKALENIKPNLFILLQEIVNKNYLEIISKGSLLDISTIDCYRVLDINLSERGYLLSLLVYFKHESIYAIYAKHDILDDVYLNDTETSPAEITLFFDESYNLKRVCSEEIFFNSQNKLDFK